MDSTTYESYGVAAEVCEERDHQINLGHTFEHDDQHTDGVLARAAAAYAFNAYRTDMERALFTTMAPAEWPPSWGPKAWNPKDRRTDLIRAAALIFAEIERLDRAAAKAGR